MKYIKLFEDFVKNYGENISQKEFKDLIKLKKRQRVLYYGQQHEVLDSDGIVARLRNMETGETTSVNLAMFNQKGAIVESENVSEGFYDQGILKAFFMAGGPGSGKSFVANEIFGFPKHGVASTSYATGLKIVNSDNAFEKMAKEAGYELSQIGQIDNEEEWARLMSFRDKAKSITKKMQSNYMAGRLGLVIDGTGKNAQKIEHQKNLLGDGLGYDTYMVFVNTTLEVALERNRQRERKLPDEMVFKMWHDVQDNIGKFQKMFGHDKMFVVDNSNYDDETLRQIEKIIAKEIKKPVQNNGGKIWLRQNDPKLKSKNQPS